MKSSSTEYLAPGLNGGSANATRSLDDDSGTTTGPTMEPLIVLSGGRDGANQNVLAFYSLSDAQKALAGGVQFLLSDPDCKRVCVQIELLNPGGKGGQKPPAANGEAAGNGELSEAAVGALVSELIGGDDDDAESDGELRPSDYGVPEPRVAAVKAPPPPAKTSPQKPAPPKPKKKADEDEEALRVPVKYWVVLGVLGFIVVGYYGSVFLSRPLSADALASRALSAGTKEVRLARLRSFYAMTRRRSWRNCGTWRRRALIPRSWCWSSIACRG